MNQASPAYAHELPGVPAAQERRRAFLKARRHTVLVRLLKWLLPLASLGIFSLYLLPAAHGPLSTDLPVSIKGIDLGGQGLKMINPRYSGGNDKLGQYTIEAEYALQKFTATHILELHGISGEIIQPGQKWTRLKASKGIYDTQKESMEMLGPINITSNQAMEARLEQARINMKKQILTSDKPVVMTYRNNRISARGMTLYLAKNNRRALFSGNVRVTIERNAPPPAGARQENTRKTQ